jgi:hypothetical protein
MNILSYDIGIKNLGYCVVQVSFEAEETEETREAEETKETRETRETKQIIDWGVMNLMPEGSQKRASAIPMSTICDELYRQISALHKRVKEPIHQVLIENQPCMKNPMMKSIQMLLYGYYGYKRQEEKVKPEIKLMSASAKLKLAKELKVECPATKSKSAYRKNKLLGIACAQHCLTMITNGEEKRKELEGKKKKDDAADAFVQAMAFLAR